MSFCPGSTRGAVWSSSGQGGKLSKFLHEIPRFTVFLSREIQVNGSVSRGITGIPSPFGWWDASALTSFSRVCMKKTIQHKEVKWAGNLYLTVHPLWTSLAAAAAKSHPTLCDPIDGSPPGSSVPGILQARILEWVAISFSNACMQSRFSRVQLCETPWTAAHQAPLSAGFSRQEYWNGLPFPSPNITGNLPKMI